MLSFARLMIGVSALVALMPAAAGSFQTTVTVAIPPDSPTIPLGIYGQYLEHVQADEQTIYPSLWDKNSRFADATGVRTDVTAAVKELGTPVVRWPGGCFADVYHWEDGIGPQSLRQAKPNIHWGGMESNMFGTDEFLHWCGLSETSAYINLNLGSGTLEEALRWVEYCNGPADSIQGKRRAANGHPGPYLVKYWGIGNETWGSWETGHTDAQTYGTSLSLWAKALRASDPTIRILGVASEEGNDETWDKTVIDLAGADLDLLTVHMYGITTRYDKSEYEAFAFTPSYLENRLKRLLHTIDSSSVSLERKAPINIAVDEWNIRHFFDGKQDRKSPRTLQDALFTAGFLNAMIRLSPRIEMANYVFLVNGNATLLVNDHQVVWTPIAHVFQQYSKWMTGKALNIDTKGPVKLPPLPVIAHPGRKPGPGYKPEPLPWLDTVAALRADGSIALSLVNRHPDTTASVSLGLPPEYVTGKSWTLCDDDIYASNTFDHPVSVVPAITSETEKRRTWDCAPHSVTLLLLVKH